MVEREHKNSISEAVGVDDDLACQSKNMLF